MTAAAGTARGERSVDLCVYCRRRPVVPDRRPFCSERCQLADLGHWLDGGYRLPEDSRVVPGESDEESGSDATSRTPDGR